MKIAQVIIGYHATVGGYGRHVNLISSELRARGHDVTIVSTNYSPASYSDEVGVVRLSNDFFLKVTPGLINYLISNDFDIVHVHGYPSFQPFLACIAKKRKGFPLVFTPHYHPQGTKPLPVRRLFDKFFGVPALKCASKVIALTDYEKVLLSKLIDDSKISVVPNPVDLKRLRKINGFKKKYGLRDYVLFVGRIERDKGINYLIKAVNGLSVDLVIIGRDVGYGKDLIKQSNVHVIGEVSQDELMMAYTECSMLALPSRYEAFGIVFIEAMSYGKPVIGTRVGPVPSIIGKSGLSVPYGEVNSLRNAVMKLMKNSASFRKNALIQSRLYNVKKVVDSLEKVYREVLRK